jgi:sialate O-acetylesterase
MVLQQNAPIPIWGRAGAGENVTVRFRGASGEATADEQGRFRLSLAPSRASAEGAELSIEAGGATRKFRDVVVGEVWLCAGQSNMAMRLANVRTADDDAASAKDPLLRTYNVQQRPRERPAEFLDEGAWIVGSPETAKEFTAVGFYFGQRLRKDLNVPVGIVLCAWGGSSVAAWMDADSMQSPNLRTIMPDDLIGWRNNVQPYRLHNGMLHPLAPYATAGVVWYQGETEGTEYQGAYRNAYHYRTLFPEMIASWRRAWHRADLPFYWIQLPNLKNPRLNWPTVRESQADALRLPHTGMITSIDIGDDGDLHPKDKRAFGERTADVILARQYGKPTPATFPELESATPENGTLRVTFRNAGKALKTTDGQPPRGFAIAGEDGKYHDATATLSGTSVILRADGVPKPRTLRYAWAQAPGVNLVSDIGLPPAPFRTDKLPVVGQHVTWQSLPSKKELATTIDGGTLAREAKSANWLATSSADDVAALLKDKQMVTASPRSCAIRFMDKPQRGMTESPTLLWTTTPDGAAKAIDAKKGVTAEVLVQSSVIAHPLRGFDLEVGVKQPDGKLRRYLLSISPMQIRAFGRNEVHVVRAEADNARQRIAFRIAVRPDGVAQVYADDEKLTLLEGELVDAGDDNVSEASYVRVGKGVEGGEYIATVVHAAFDAAGAFAP